jgi:glycosyltransferase involved in cell wall biosynthesis
MKLAPPNQSDVHVSYVISTKNRADHLEKILANVRDFITSADELIIADGGSTDGTLELVQANADLVTTFISAPDAGEAHGFNRALLESRGRLIKFLTDDDYFYPAAMRQCIEYLDNHADVDALIAGGVSYSVDEQGNKRFLYNHGLPDGVTYEDCTGTNWNVSIAGQGTIVRRDVLARVGLFENRKKMVDMDFIARLLAHRVRVKYIDCRLFDHYIWKGAGCAASDATATEMREWVAALFLLGDWPAAASKNFRPTLAAFKLQGYDLGVRSAFRSLLFLIRNHGTLAGKLFGTLFILPGFVALIVTRSRNLLRRLQKAIAKKPDAASLAERQHWTGGVR